MNDFDEHSYQQRKLKEERTMSQEKLNHIVAGVLYDFMGYLTTREEVLTLSSHHDAAPAAEVINEFLSRRNVGYAEPFFEWHMRCAQDNPPMFCFDNSMDKVCPALSIGEVPNETGDVMQGECGQQGWSGFKKWNKACNMLLAPVNCPIKPDKVYGESPVDTARNDADILTAACYSIENLRKVISDLQDFAIWMTGCGYDFTQHEYFCEQRDRLLKWDGKAESACDKESDIEDCDNDSAVTEP